MIIKNFVSIKNHINKLANNEKYQNDKLSNKELLELYEILENFCVIKKEKYNLEKQIKEKESFINIISEYNSLQQLLISYLNLSPNETQIVSININNNDLYNILNVKYNVIHENKIIDYKEKCISINSLNAYRNSIIHGYIPEPTEPTEYTEDFKSYLNWFNEKYPDSNHLVQIDENNELER